MTRDITIAILTALLWPTLGLYALIVIWKDMRKERKR